jgi:hypothetical protein
MFNVRLLNVPLKMATQVKLVYVEAALVSGDQLLIAQMLAMMQVQQRKREFGFTYFAVRLKPQCVFTSLEKHFDASLHDVFQTS